MNCAVESLKFQIEPRCCDCMVTTAASLNNAINSNLCTVLDIVNEIQNHRNKMSSYTISRLIASLQTLEIPLKTLCGSESLLKDISNLRKKLNSYILSSGKTLRDSSIQLPFSQELESILTEISALKNKHHCLAG